MRMWINLYFCSGSEFHFSAQLYYITVCVYLYLRVHSICASDWKYILKPRTTNGRKVKCFTHFHFLIVRFYFENENHFCVSNFSWKPVATLFRTFLIIINKYIHEWILYVYMCLWFQMLITSFFFVTPFNLYYAYIPRIEMFQFFKYSYSWMVPQCCFIVETETIEKKQVSPTMFSENSF